MEAVFSPGYHSVAGILHLLQVPRLCKLPFSLTGKMVCMIMTDTLLLSGTDRHYSSNRNRISCGIQRTFQTWIVPSANLYPKFNHY